MEASYSPEDAKATLEKIATTQEVKESTPEPQDPMRELIRLRQREAEIGAGLDNDVLNVSIDAFSWMSKFSWEDVGGEGSDAFDVKYRFKSTDESGQPVTLDVTRDTASGVQGIRVVETDAQGNENGTTIIVGDSMRNDARLGGSGGQARVAFIDSNDKKLYLASNKVEESGSIAFGYDNSPNCPRKVFINPSIDNLPNPVDQAKRIMDKLKAGSLTHKAVEGHADWGEFKPVATPAQPPQVSEIK